jgi:CrcB protein
MGVQWVWLFVGGGLGAMARFALSGQVLRHAGEGFPWGTLAVNWAGCLAIGAAAVAFDAWPGHPANLRLFAVAGVLGGFTTFSAFGLEAWELVADGVTGPALLYVGASVAGGIGAVVAGAALARWVAAS